MRTDRTRLISHFAAIICVAAAVALRVALLGTDAGTGFLLSGIVVAGAAWFGGMAPAIVATLTAVLAERIFLRVDFAASLVLIVEGLLIAGLATSASAAAGRTREALAAADARIRDLLGVQARLRRSDALAARLEQVAAECAAMVVDESGRVAEWRDGAARLFGWSADAIVGRPAAQLFAPNDDFRLEPLLAGVSGERVSQFHCACSRADGTVFDADVEINRIANGGARLFAVIVRDRSREQEWRAFADAAADMQTALREEADVAQRQLATLQSLTDPTLNLMPAAEAVRVLLDRLREAVDADGVALVHGVHQRRHVVAASDGLQPDGRAERRNGTVSAPQVGRILVVHNDPARVMAVSAAAWRDDAGSLIALPVASGSHVEGTLEVVGVKRRRSTDWEIALAQVVAAQIAGRLHEDRIFGAGAVA